MDTTATISELRALAAGAQRPAAARLRDLFDEVQAAIRAGVRRVVIRDALARNGLDIPFATFVRTLARIRKERGVVARRSAVPHPETGSSVQRAEEAPIPAAVRAPTLANDADTTPRAAATPPVARERRPIVSVGARLPDDWLTADLTRDQKRLLTSDQRSARAEAKVKKFFPNPFDPAVPQNDNPA
ncbi:hypothetical protein ACV22V_31160 [Burkholderia sp. AW33-5]